MSVRMLLSLALFALLSVSSLPSPSAGLYFHVQEGSKRCFLEEVPEDVLVLGRYTSLDHSLLSLREGQPDPDGLRSAIRVTVTDPRQDVLLKYDTVAEGKFAFTSVVGGEHLICLSTNTSNWYGQQRSFRVSLQLDIGENAADYSEIAKQEHLSAIEVEVRKLNDKIRAIRAEQEYQRAREERFRDTSESTNSRVMWWSIAQTAVLLAAGGYQLLNLKNFFKSKKLA